MKVLGVFLLLCFAAGSTSIGSQRTRSFAASSGGVRVNVTWTVKTYMAPGLPGPAMPVDSIAAARATFSGHDVVTSSASLDQFLFPFTGHNVDWVHSSKDGCGAAMPVAFIPSSSARRPYVAFFTILGEKGCLAMPLVFAPVQSEGRWTYRAAPELQIETAAHPSPFTNLAFRRNALFHITRVERVRLPSAQQYGFSRWFVDIAYGTIGNTPAVYTLDRWDQASVTAHAGEIIEIGENHRARVAATV
jgi:hypothetical protein